MKLINYIKRLFKRRPKKLILEPREGDDVTEYFNKLKNVIDMINEGESKKQ